MVVVCPIDLHSFAYFLGVTLGVFGGRKWFQSVENITLKKNFSTFLLVQLKKAHFLEVLVLPPLHPSRSYLSIQNYSILNYLSLDYSIVDYSIVTRRAVRVPGL